MVFVKQENTIRWAGTYQQVGVAISEAAKSCHERIDSENEEDQNSKNLGHDLLNEAQPFMGERSSFSKSKMSESRILPERSQDGSLPPSSAR